MFIPILQMFWKKNIIIYNFYVWCHECHVSLVSLRFSDRKRCFFLFLYLYINIFIYRYRVFLKVPKCLMTLMTNDTHDTVRFKLQMNLFYKTDACGMR